MKNWMRNIAIVAALLAAMPLIAQEPKPEPVPPAPQLEKPEMAPEEPAPKAVLKPAEKAKAGVAKPSNDVGKVVEEIIARVNNEIITRSEYDKSLAQGEE